ncbi:hypothetical protein [Nocardia brasiliensis]|uniref:hypothetical protein n=1 Tax=Nocardia brasiliensis TaxID=37326 RepID=UPI0018940A23|nr:hypothetical protein [Nocardia brasiliensis]MBF6541976.1 hypothetical protein [Nocardia brasiliensis]
MADLLPETSVAGAPWLRYLDQRCRPKDSRPRSPRKFIKITSSKSAPIHVYWRGDNRVRCATKAGALLVN